MSRVEEILKMMETDDKDSFLRYALALEYEKLDKINKAINCIKDLLKDDPEYLGAYYKLGRLHEIRNKFDEAEKIYKKGILLAEEKNDNKTKGELEEALWLIEED